MFQFVDEVIDTLHNSINSTNFVSFLNFTDDSLCTSDKVFMRFLAVTALHGVVECHITYRCHNYSVTLLVKNLLLLSFL